MDLGASVLMMVQGWSDQGQIVSLIQNFYFSFTGNQWQRIICATRAYVDFVLLEIEEIKGIEYIRVLFSRTSRGKRTL